MNNNDFYNDGTLPQDSLIQGMQNAVGQQNNNSDRDPFNIYEK